MRESLLTRRVMFDGESITEEEEEEEEEPLKVRETDSVTAPASMPAARPP